MGGSLGFSKSKSQSGSQQNTFVDPAQSPFLAQLRGLGLDITQQQLQGIGSLFGLSQGLQGQGQQLLGGVQGAQQQLGQGQQFGFGQGQGGIDALQGLASGDNPSLQALQRQATGQNPQLNNQIGQLGTDLSRNFLEQLNPAITSQAIGGGQLGGGRQGVAQGLGIQATQDAFSRGATQLRSDDIGRQLQASQAVAGIQGQAGSQLAGLGGQQQFQQAGLNQQGQFQSGQLGLGGLGQLQSLFNLGFSPFEAQFSPLQSLAGIIGQPTVLGQGTSQGSSSAFSVQGGGGVL